MLALNLDVPQREVTIKGVFAQPQVTTKRLKSRNVSLCTRSLGIPFFVSFALTSTKL